MTYQPNIPTGTVNLNEDYLNLRENFQQLDAIYGINHTAYSDQTAGEVGYHTVVNLFTQPSVPAGVANTLTMVSRDGNDGYADRERLFLRPGSNSSYPLTVNFTPVAATHGSTFLAGTIVLQWGTEPVVTIGDHPILFATNNRNFAFNCFCVLITGVKATTGGDGIFLKTGSVSTTGFTAINSSGTMDEFTWVAIGN